MGRAVLSRRYERKIVTSSWRTSSSSWRPSSWCPSWPPSWRPSLQTSSWPRFVLRTKLAADLRIAGSCGAVQTDDWVQPATKKVTSISFLIHLLKSFIRLISSSKTRSTSGTHVEYLYAFFEILQHVFGPFRKNRSKKCRSKTSRTRRAIAR